MEKIGKISLVGYEDGPVLTLDLNHRGSGMPGFYVVDHDEEFHWQLNPDSVVALVNLLNDSMLLMMRAMAVELYKKEPDMNVSIVRPTDTENVVPFRRT